VDAADSRANERVMARAMLNLQHRAMDDDKAGLKRIMDDSSAPANERELAAIIHHLDHRPSHADKQKLQGMMKAK